VDYIELLKLAIVVIGAGWCIAREKHHPVLYFIGFSLGTEVLQVDLGPTITGLQVVGLVHLLFMPRVFGTFIRTPAGRTLAYSLVLLAILVVVYGYLLPWPDKTGERPWTQRSEGRSIINFSSTIAHVSAALYVATVVQIREYRERIVDYLLVGTTLASVGCILEVLTQTDLFSILAPNRREWMLSEAGRARGFNAEPRASGSLSAAGLVMLLGPGMKTNAKVSVLLLIHALGVAFTTSTLALVLLVVGVTSMLLLTRRVAIVAVAALFALLTVIGLSAWFGDSPIQLWVQYTGERFATREAAVDSRTFGDMVVQSLEVFDACAMGFLITHPQHMIVGVGPGLVSLPGSDYVPAGNAYYIFGDRIDSIPFMGLVRTLADSGFLGLAFWFWNIGQLTVAFHKCEQMDPTDASWRQLHTSFLVFTLLCFLQTRPSWYVWLGTGLGAAIVVWRAEAQASLAARETRRALQANSRPVAALRAGS
jgi:hypothetical protein